MYLESIKISEEFIVVLNTGCKSHGKFLKYKLTRKGDKIRSIFGTKFLATYFQE